MKLWLVKRYGLIGLVVLIGVTTVSQLAQAAPPTGEKLRAAILTPEDLGTGFRQTSLSPETGERPSITAQFQRDSPTTIVTVGLFDATGFDVSLVARRFATELREPPLSLVSVPAAGPGVGDESVRYEVLGLLASGAVAGEFVVWRQGEVVAIVIGITAEGVQRVQPWVSRQQEKLVEVFSQPASNVSVSSTSGQGESVPLPRGCTNVTLTWAVGTPLSDVAAAAEPADAVASIFRQDPTQQRFVGYSPDAPDFANDYSSITMSLEPVFICMSEEGSLTRPTVGAASAPSIAASPSPPPPSATPPPAQNCSPAYPTVCIPPPPPDLDCGDIPHRRFTVLPPDPHRFDGSDNDGVGCETG